MKIIVLDIETITPRYVPETDTEFPNITFHEPVVINWLYCNTVSKKIGLCEHSDSKPGWETLALAQFTKHAMAADKLITWNGRGFDLPLMQVRAWVHGLDWRWWQDRNHRFSRYNCPLYHYDLLDMASEYGASKRMSLDDMAKVLGLPGKRDVDGSQVNELWKKDKQKVIDYCLDDVLQTWFIAITVLLLDGSLLNETLTQVSERIEQANLSYDHTA